MQRTLALAAVALMSLAAAGLAHADSGDGGDRVVDANAAPPGFYVGMPGYDNQRSAEAYVVREEDQALAARTTGQHQAAQRQNANLG